MLKVFVVASTVLLLAACAEQPVQLDMAAYDQSCQVDSDCVLVSNVCRDRGCRCPTGAINVADEARFDADIEALSCPLFEEAQLCMCIEVRAECAGGTCRRCQEPGESGNDIPLCGGSEESDAGVTDGG